MNAIIEKIKSVITFILVPFAVIGLIAWRLLKKEEAPDNGYKEAQNNLEKLGNKLKEEVKVIEKKKEELKVEDKSLESEVEYWNKEK